MPNFNLMPNIQNIPSCEHITIMEQKSDEWPTFETEQYFISGGQNMPDKQEITSKKHMPDKNHMSTKEQKTQMFCTYETEEQLMTAPNFKKRC